jgi:uncharacterized protein YdaU (DUF1376 family)
MKPDTWMPIYVGDYLRDTIGLTFAEHGAYLLTIFAYWTNGGPLTEKQARRASGRFAVTVAKFFTVSGGVWKHKRIDAELAKAKAFSEKQRHAAVMRWQCHGNAVAMPRECPSPSPSQTTNLVGKEPGLKRLLEVLAGMPASRREEGT